MRGNVKIRKMQIVYIVYLLTKLCNIFDKAYFIDVSIVTVEMMTFKKRGKSAIVFMSKAAMLNHVNYSTLT